MSNPSVQILIPTYNRAKYLHRAIGSCLSQTYENIQVIISDNASNDGTHLIGGNYATLFPRKVRYFRNETNIGMTSNWIRLLYEISDSDYCLLLSDDDELIDSSFISKAINKISDIQRQISLVFGDTLLLDEISGEHQRSSIITHQWPEIIDFNALVKGWRSGGGSRFGNHIILSGALFERRLAVQAGAFKSGLLSADFELWWSLLALGSSACYIKTVASSYTKHDNNEAVRTKYMFSDWIKNFNCYLNPMRILPLSQQRRYRSYLLRIFMKSLVDFCGTELHLFRFRLFLSRAACADPRVAAILSDVLYSYRLIYLLPYLIFRPLKMHVTGLFSK